MYLGITSDSTKAKKATVLEELRSFLPKIRAELLAILEREDFDSLDDRVWECIMRTLYTQCSFKQGHLAESFGVSQAMISRWGRGDAIVSISRRTDYLEITKQLLRT